MNFTENKSGDVIYMTSPNIKTLHAFTTRYGGVSNGKYSSLNLGVALGDDPELVRKNYDILCDAIGIKTEDLVFSHQVHKDEIRSVTLADKHTLFTEVPYEADALITNVSELPLIIFTADCTPILLHDPVSHVVGAVHAGWRGTVSDIAGKTVRKMSILFGCRPENITAAIGPCISACCFETGADVADAVSEVLDGDTDDLIAPKGEKYYVDLKGVNRRLLERAGLLPDNISVSDECTYCSHDKYWSHRYTSGNRGSQASIIMLKGNS